MSTRGLTIWCNARLSTDAMAFLHDCTSGHNLSIDDPLALTEADVAFGQPEPAEIIASQRLRWIHLTTASSARYDRDDVVVQAMRARDGVITTSASIFREPCAQHILAMMLAGARRLPHAWQEQQTNRAWPSQTERARCGLLTGQTVMLYGYGAIAARVTELLAPFGDMQVIGVRRSPASAGHAGDRVRIVATDEADTLLPQADHVINLLPLTAVTTRYFSESRLDRLKPGAAFYNVGRGATVDHDALMSMLRSGRLGAAFLDVTDPQPLPRDHPLWSEANCYITPQTSSGRADESQALVSHFLDNLVRFCAGTAMLDRVRSIVPSPGTPGQG